MIIIMGLLGNEIFAINVSDFDTWTSHVASKLELNMDK